MDVWVDGISKTPNQKLWLKDGHVMSFEVVIYVSLLTMS